MRREDFTTSITERFQDLQTTMLETLSQLFKQDFSLSPNLTESENPKAAVQTEAFPKVVVKYHLVSPEEAVHIWTLPVDLTTTLYAWMVGGDPVEELGEEQLEGIKEGSNQIIGQIAAALDVEGIALEIDGLEVSLMADSEGLGLDDLSEEGVTVEYAIEVAGNSYATNQHIFQTFDADDGESLETTLSDEEIDRMLNGDDLDTGTDPENAAPQDEVDVQQVEFGSFSDDNPRNGGGHPRNIDMLLDVDLEILVELGRKNMLIKDVLKLGKGSVVELDKAAGEPLEIFANGRKLAEGEVVVIDDHFGIRITHLVGTAERIKSLG